MADPTLILTDPQGVEIAAVSDVDLDLAYGVDENQFQAIIRDDFDRSLFTRGSRIFMDGTEYGGIVHSMTSSVSTAGTIVQYSGRTWQGLLSKKVLSPDSGQDYLTVNGSISTVLTQLFARINLDDIFVADPNAKTISYQFERYTDAWSGLQKMATASSLKLHMTYSHGHVQVSLLPVQTFEDVVDSDLLDFVATKDYRPVNHLIGLGTGELKERAVSHWFADAKGNVSQTQTLFGVDEVTEIYDYSNAEKKELEEETKKKLIELQSEGSIEVTLHDDVTLDLGDRVAARDNTTGLTVTAEVTKKIVKISMGVLSVNYEVGQNESTSNLSGSSESFGGGGASYTAGDGIDITNHVITAEVTQSDIDTIASDTASAVRQVSDLAADVGTAQQTADAAVVSASSAQSTANTAVSKANAAQSTADSAVSAAGVAQTTAEAAQDTANSATSTAGSAVQSISAASPLTATRSGNIVTLSAPAATPTSAGWMRMLDKAKLDGIDEGANNYTLPPASASTLGGVKPDGKTITVSSDGMITAQSNSAASFLAAWPVGSIFHSTRSTNPGSLYGGTWQALESLGGYLWERLT